MKFTALIVAVLENSSVVALAIGLSEPILELAC